ncbi:MAG: hypothetical protein FWC47_09830 [Oscillospiraceae bacterium]|nr:hypothetical protein [Oscillospiraceae bacterium]
MINAVVQKNAVVVVYDTLSDGGKMQKKRQELNLVAFDAENEDFYAIGKAVGDMLVSAPKEILKTSTALLVEV